MKNKTLAIFGVGTYILSVIVSASDSAGNPVVPVILILASGLATIIFIIMATVRLWKVYRISSIVLVLSYLVSIIREFFVPADGSQAMFLFNITRVISFLVFFWAISLFWAMAKHEKLETKPKSNP